MHSTSGDEDGNVGTFSSLACPGNLVHFLGRKPPLPTVPLMRHAGPLAYTERKAPCHCIVCQGSGVKEAAVRGGGIEGDHREGI